VRLGSRVVRYAVLLADYQEGGPTWDEMNDEQRALAHDQHVAFAKACADHPEAEIVGGEALAGGDAATTMRTGVDGSVTLTDGPFTEAVEHMGGFYIIDVPDLDVLVELCRTLPPYVIELRPVIDVPDRPETP
jgi:hypothetical protein